MVSLGDDSLVLYPLSGFTIERITDDIMHSAKETHLGRTAIALLEPRHQSPSPKGGYKESKNPLQNQSS